MLKTLACFSWSLSSKQTWDTHGYQFAGKCAHSQKHTPLFDDMFPHAVLCWITTDFWLASLFLFSFIRFSFSYYLCVRGFVNISPLNLWVSFDRALFLSELIPKKGENVKHRIHYWTSQPGKPQRDIYILWPLSVPLVSSQTQRLQMCWRWNRQVTLSEKKNKWCKILHLASCILTIKWGKF